MDGLFGSKARTDILVAVGRLESTYVSELARVLKRRIVDVRRAVLSLERAGVLQTRRVGTIRLVELDKRFPERNELAELLSAMSERPLYAALWKSVRRRPRAIGKE